MNPLSTPLPVAVRRQGEIIGIVAGIVCFPVALYVGAMEAFCPKGPAAFVLPIVILTALAGAIASLTTDESKAPDIGGVPLRVGARAGFIASLVAGAFTVLASTFHSFGIGSPASVVTAGAVRCSAWLGDLDILGAVHDAVESLASVESVSLLPSNGTKRDATNDLRSLRVESYPGVFRIGEGQIAICYFAQDAERLHKRDLALLLA